MPQPRFAAVRALAEAGAAAETVGFPAVLKPADSGGQRGLFLLESLDDLDAHLHAALAESPTGEAILEEFADGLELNGLVVARGRRADRAARSPTGCGRRAIGFGVGWIHVYPSTLFGDALDEAERVALRAVRALGLRGRDRVPAADRRRRRRGRRRRGRGADPRRADGRPRPPRASASTSSRSRCGRRSASRVPDELVDAARARSRSRSGSSPPSPGRCRPGR